MRIDWSALPDEVREGVEAQTGGIRRIEAAPAGNHADIASTLYTVDGRVFVKAARKEPDGDGPEVKSLRWEAAINPHVAEHAPRLHWTVEAGGWLVLGFEHVEARHADYRPGSPDLEALAKVVDALQAMPCPDVLDRRRVDRPGVPSWAGDTLLHCDLNPANLLIADDGTVRVVDWAFVSRGAAFIELARLIPWLLKAGHEPARAEDWVARFPSWSGTEPAHIDQYARAFADRWRKNTETNRAQWALEHAAAARRWAEHRAS
ncbi:phosphotransferase family protein [Actinomadura sp. WMMB 499]|uniref:phosphotransferase family protein n=1 Tax=Actinomadura sp. WMMB 499 TaxID=1219491 RepID=UPI0012490759|nr:phosphotransferase [Actinomadura sp. WMMB 499]QFG22350.1 phosphotransferase [Actinomadura sp. WMMB 499]